MFGDKSQQENKLNVVEMTLLRWISGHVRQERIINEYIREKVGVELIVEKMVDYCLRWFRYVRWFVEVLVRRV